MHITLMRHGRPRMPPAKWLAPADMGSWIAQYDRSEIDPAGMPAGAAQAALGAAVIVTSTAPRAISSAQALGPIAFSADEVFCEAPLPFSLWRFPRLPVQAWAALFRLLWLGGYARGADSVHATRERAGDATARLVALAGQGPVLLVGHGIMNRLIARKLIAAGWRERARHDSGYWGTSVYTLPG